MKYENTLTWIRGWHEGEILVELINRNKESWELVSATTDALYFKRPIQ